MMSAPNIEAGIRPLVDALNATEYCRTVASCEGHRLRGEPPYVYFVADPRYVSLLARAVESACLQPKGSGLRYHWTITGRFDLGELRYSLHSTCLDGRCESAPIAVWRRGELDGDMAVLVRLIRETAGRRSLEAPPDHDERGHSQGEQENEADTSEQCPGRRGIGAVAAWADDGPPADLVPTGTAGLQRVSEHVESPPGGTGQQANWNCAPILPNSRHASQPADPNIEPGIRPLVDALNATGYCRTVASCEGHRVKREFLLLFGHPPYVMFEAPEAAARALSSRMWDAWIAGRLNHSWRLEGVFYRDQLRFAVRSDWHDCLVPWGILAFPFWRRRRIRQDVERLANLVRELGPAFATPSVSRCTEATA